MSLTVPKFAPYDARTTIINVVSYEGKNPVGTISNPYYGNEIPFRSLTELLLTAEAIFNELELPKASTNMRSFTVTAGSIVPVSIIKPAGALATFNLKIQFRQNTSWQGNLTWVNENSEAPFRSVYELICLMNSALTSITNQ